MPITYRIDSIQRVVFTTVTGDLDAQQMYTYQEEVWSRLELAGYSELVDMTNVGRIIEPAPDKVHRLAALAAGMDVAHPSKFAVAAPSDLAYGLARMYVSVRETVKCSNREAGVFRSRAEALAWLGVHEPVK